MDKDEEVDSFFTALVAGEYDAKWIPFVETWHFVGAGLTEGLHRFAYYEKINEVIESLHFFGLTEIKKELDNILRISRSYNSPEDFRQDHELVLNRAEDLMNGQMDKIVNVLYQFLKNMQTG